MSTRATEEYLGMVATKLQFQQQHLPFTYLGAPISRGKSRCLLFYAIVARIRDRLCHWSSRLLSSWGKLILLRHVLIFMPMFLLQVLDPPQAVLAKLGRICNSFLWDKDIRSKSIHWVSWEKLCYPTEEGGLGFAPSRTYVLPSLVNFGGGYKRAIQFGWNLCIPSISRGAILPKRRSPSLLRHGDGWRALETLWNKTLGGVWAKALWTFGTIGGFLILH
ncbi:uncharacterized protein [Coffea arabica]|uniref:Uncharacterized protein n=1 Tax=Coffea arabica TaxID=13443 RepID=A0A6P6VIW2_COFAR|nr:uncharacterized protein LOC113724299 [Coffea arabica]